MNAATALTESDLIALDQWTRARAVMLQAGCVFTRDERNGAISYTGELSDEQWGLIEALDAQDEVEAATARKSAEPVHAHTALSYEIEMSDTTWRLEMPRAGR
jgi:hypothetical protein